MESVLIYNVQAGPIWDWRVVVDLFCGGVGVGASLLAVILSGSRDSHRLRIGQTAAFVGPVMVVIGLLFLFTKLGNQLNVHQMMLNVAPTSVMWWGFLIQSALVLAGLIYAWQWRDIINHSGRQITGYCVGTLAILVGLYHGVLLGALTSRPLWSNGSMLFLSMTAFLSTGIAGALFANQMRGVVGGDAQSSLRPIVMALALSLVLMLIAIINSWVNLKFGSLASQQALAAASDAYSTLLVILGIGAGLLLPFVMLALMLWRGAGEGFSLPVVVLACLLVLVGGFATRYVVVLGGQLPPPIATLS
jgi:formate-dependent nitrite reductase membrane component NrfD